MLRYPCILRTALCSLILVLSLAGAQASADDVSPTVKKVEITFDSLGLRMMAAMISGEEDAERTSILISMKGLDEPLLLSEGDLIAGYTLRNADEYKVELVKDDEVQMLAIRNLGVVRADPNIKTYVGGYTGMDPDKSPLYSELPKTEIVSVDLLPTQMASADVPEKYAVPGKKKRVIPVVPVSSVLPPKFRSPMKYTRVSSPYGWRVRPRSSVGTGSKYHPGIDLAAPHGTPVHAAASGKIIASGYSYTRGNYIYIRHNLGYETRYLHLSKRYVKSGDSVTSGDRIALEGSTGISTGPHLHFEIRKNDKTLDPARFVSLK